VSRWLEVARSESLALLLFTPLVLLIQGYHPWSDDAAIYVAGIRKMLDPSLYRSDASFVLEHTKVSVFSHLLAQISLLFRIPLEALLLLAYLGSMYLFLYASRRLAVRLFESEHVRWTATFIAGICFTLPVAGTALFVMDPYVTARSFSTPFGMLAVVSALDRSWKRMALWTVLTVSMHPQMGAYLIGFLTILILVDYGRWRSVAVTCALACLLCAGITVVSMHMPVTAAYRDAVLSRTYFFPGLWKWYEYIGLIAPLLLLGLTWARGGTETVTGKLAATCVLVGGCACLTAFSLVHTQGPYMLARIQLLRTFQIIYTLGLVMLGGFIGMHFMVRRRWIGISLILIAATGMYLAERQTYPTCAHIEWPGAEPVSPWEQAYVWIRNDTPRDAVFAVSPSLMKTLGDDTPGFRAITERSVLTDNKDKGVTSLFPSIAEEWLRRQDAERGLDAISDQQREVQLHPFGVGWLLLPVRANTLFPCPYRNSIVKVCQMIDERLQAVR
jgi:hypothetical protein